MAWTNPRTWIAGEALNFTKLNTELRDNLNVTAPGVASAAGNLIVTDAANSVVERTPASAQVLTAESTSTVTFTDLTTAGPSVTATTGTSALVIITAAIEADTAGEGGFVGVAISGASTVAAGDNDALYFASHAAATSQRGSLVIFSSLTAGSNTFKLRYRASGAGAITATFRRRTITVIPF